MAIEAILFAQIDDPLAWKQAHLPIGKAELAIGIIKDHHDAAYIGSRLGTAGLVNKLLGRNNADMDPTSNLSAEFERLRQRINPGDLVTLDKILQFNPEALGTNIQSKIMHLMNKTDYDHLFVDSNVRNKGRLLSLHASWASSDHTVTYKHRPHTIRRHDRMPYVQNIITNEAGLMFCLEKTDLIASRKDRPADILLLMFYAGQDAWVDSMITHPLQPTFIDRVAKKSHHRQEALR
ncbi:unnamed protein product [Sphagnum jensenii]|uniref:Uncharacterized protein n=1 Tax=Sphagnum jensenii TaxID=128206 RepID=A0ABP0VQJ9_9BRYO